MKLRNLMYATMIACAFASCSNDDVIENGPDAKGDASLTIDLGVKSTKADIAAGTETAVNDINIFLLEQETGTVIIVSILLRKLNRNILTLLTI